MKKKKFKKYSKVKCDNCLAVGHVVPLGRAHGNTGKKQFKCDSCGHYWQYGY